MDEDGYIVIKTTKTEVWTDVEEGKPPFMDFRLKIEGDYDSDPRIMKYILSVYDEHRNKLFADTDVYETISKFRIKDILDGKFGH